MIWRFVSMRPFSYFDLDWGARRMVIREEPPGGATREIHVPVSFGEILDKLSILEIKAARIEGEDKLANVLHELDALRSVWTLHFGSGFGGADELVAKLKATNLALWDIEDEIRACESRHDFGADFIRLARSVYKTNDVRAAIKNEINRLLGSPFREEKSYKAGSFENQTEGRLPDDVGAERSDDDTGKGAADPVGHRRRRP